MMSKIMIKSVFTIGLLTMLLAIPVYGASVNQSIEVEAGSKVDGATTVNGSISVGKGAVVSGSINTVNGKIRVDGDATIENATTVNGSLHIADGVRSENLATVNGSVKVGEGSTVAGEIEAVNGSISLAAGSTVALNIANVNGDIELTGSEVGGDLTTVNGNVELADRAVVKGDIVVEKPGFWSFGNGNSRMPEIVIGPGSSVEGVIRLEREVKLYISETANVGGVEGEMSMSDAVRFSGKRP